MINKTFPSILLIAFIFPLFGYSKDSIPYLLNQLEKVSGKDKIHVYHDLAWEYKNIELDSATYFIEQAIKLSQKTRSDEEIFINLLLYGTIESNKGNYSRSSELYYEALGIAERSNSSINLEPLYVNLSNLHNKMGEYPKALSCYLHAVKVLPEKEKTPENLLRNSLALSNLYFNIDRPDSAEYYKRAGLKYLPQVKEKEVRVDAMNSLGLGYLNVGQLDSALFYLQKSLELNRELGDLKWEGITMLHLGGIYAQELNLPQKAIDEYFMPALGIFQRIQNQNQLLETYDWISLAYEEINIDSAYEYLNLYVGLSEELFERDKIKEINELEKRYQTVKFARDKAQLSNKINGLLALSIFLALLATAFGFQYQRMRVKRILEDQENQEQKQLLLERLRNQEISSMNAMMELQGNERERIAADLHDRVGSLLATLKFNYEAMEDPIERLSPAISQNFIQTNKILDQACKDVRAISHDINSGILTQFGLVHAIEEMKEAIERSGKMTINLDTFGIDDRLESTQEIFLYRIIQEMVTNVIKHADASEVDIQLSRNENEISLIIEDNGKGFDSQKIKEKKGMGLNNLKMRVEQLGGKFNIDSSIGQGTSIVIEVPAQTKMKA
ncbi:MAG: ATP-binding protein [Bacteroidia bacterium]|nr:ATP-binding protein [Bacteroidia bacterium]